MKPIIAISMGDPAGISPEIICAILEDAISISTPIVFGHYPTMRELLAPDWLTRVKQLDVPEPLPEGQVGFVSTTGGGEAAINTVGKASAVAQFEGLKAAATAVLNGSCAALVTAPVAKNAIASLGIAFSGHTEYLAHRAGLAKDDVTMVFTSDSLSVGMMTTHIPLRDVPDAVTWKRLERTVGHVIDTRRRIRPDEKPNIAVAALNPHAGEDGLFGTEEQDLLIPFCGRQRCEENVFIHGPFPADTVFRDALAGKYNGVIACYHDQALIPLKLAGVGQMVNVTMGLPFIRTSPDHGVAYEIARTGSADPAGFRMAFRTAVLMSQA